MHDILLLRTSAHLQQLSLISEDLMCQLRVPSVLRNFAAILAFAAASWITPAAAADADKLKLIEQDAAAWSHDMDGLLAGYTEDLVYEDRPLGKTFRGKAEFRAFVEGFFKAFPDLKAVITSTIISGDRAASEWRFTGTQTGDLQGLPAANKQMDVLGASIYEFEGGKIKRKIDYWDFGTVLRQLSATPTN